MIIGDIIQRIQSLYSKGVQSDDTRLKSRHIYNVLITNRNNKLSTVYRLGYSNYQELSCVELEEVSPSLCDCIPFNCTVKRSKYPIPVLLQIGTDIAVKRISSIDGKVIFSKTSLEKLSRLKGNRYTSNNPFFYVRDNYLYIENRKGIDVVSVEAIFADPVEAYLHPSYCDLNNDCTSILEKRFPIDDSLIETVVRSTVYELVNSFTKVKEDTTNDTSEDKERVNEEL